MAKKILFVIVLMLALVCVFASCGEYLPTLNGEDVHICNGERTVLKEATCKEEGVQTLYCMECGVERTETIPIKKEIHEDFVDRMLDANQESSYEELYALYTEMLAHENENGCEIKDDFDWSTPHYEKYKLMTSMLYGEWKNANGDYISYTYKYENYDNTKGDTWYGTNLTTSKISGNTYYYYAEVKNNKLVIGYEDKLTEDKTDNFVIMFNTSSITIESIIENKTYTLDLNTTYEKAQKGNAKTAYVYIAKQIFNYKVPDSVRVTQCYVDYDEKIVYATIQASNSFGGTVSEKYKFYMIGNYYYKDEYSHNYPTNIDLDELNQKLQNYVSNGR